MLSEVSNLWCFSERDRVFNGIHMYDSTMLWEWSIDASSEPVQLRWTATRRPACVTDVQYLFLCDRTHTYHSYKYFNIKTLCLFMRIWVIKLHETCYYCFTHLLQRECEFYCRIIIVSLSRCFEMMTNYVRLFKWCFFSLSCNVGLVLTNSNTISCASS